MSLASNSVVLSYPSFNDEVWEVWQTHDRANGAADLSTATSTGRVADIIPLAIESSGAAQFYIVTRKDETAANEGMINLLRRWIHEYGDEEDPDLDLQLAELRRHRLAFREKC